jgi:AraC-like DNA-binding protein
MRQHGRYVETTDWDRASRVVADVYFPHELTTLGGRVAPRVALDSVALGPCLLGHVGWGADVRIACDYPGAYEVNVPLTGHLETRGAGGSATAVAGRHAAVFAADAPSEISRWDATCHVVGVKIERSHLEREADRLLGAALRPRDALPALVDLATPAGRDWAALVTSLSTQLRRPGGLLDSDVVTTQLAGVVVAGFLLAAVPDVPAAPARPGMVKRLLDRLHDDPARAWTAADMAEVAGASVRRLQEAFRDYVGATPTQVLLDLRLDRARDDLRSGEPVTVSDLAARWGFSSASRFAAAYRARYGVSPAADRG